MGRKDKSNIMFRTSMGGFNKEDVNRYIQVENIKFSSLEDEYNDKISSLERDLEAARADIALYSEERAEIIALREEAAELRNSVTKLTEELAAKDELLSKTIDDSASLKDEITKSNEKSISLMAENSSLREELNAAKRVIADLETRASDPARMIGEYRPSVHVLSDDEKDQVNDMLLRARHASEDILKRAEEGAEIIIDRAKDEMYSHRYEAVKAARDIFAAATEELRRSIGICMNDFVAAIRNSKHDPSRTADAVDVCDNDLSRRIERMQNDLDRAIAEKLAEFGTRK